MEAHEKDLQIIEEYKKTRNNNLLAPLFKQYSDAMFGLAFYYLKDRDKALDVVMDAFEIILRTIHTKDITYFKGWALSICRNTCLKRLRDEKSFDELTDYSESFVESDAPLEYTDEQIDQLIEFIRELKEEQRICIEGFYLNKWSYQNISAQYGFSLNEVKSYIQNGKRNLMNMFERIKKTK